MIFKILPDNPVEWEEVLAMVPDATEDEVASWAESAAAAMRRKA